MGLYLQCMHCCHCWHCVCHVEHFMTKMTHCCCHGHMWARDERQHLLVHAALHLEAHAVGSMGILSLMLLPLYSATSVPRLAG